jgi:hypothetical protein
MRSLSPSSRLVLAAVAVAIAALLLVGRNPAPAGSAPSPSVPGVALASNSAGATPAATSDLASPVPASPTAIATSRPTSRPTPRSTPRATPRPTPKPASCTPTDQVKYIYNPDRLQVAASCIRINGTVQAVRKEADGDLHILVALDAKYRYLLRPANQGEELGDLVVEPVCVRTVSQADAIADCAADPDPLSPPFPGVGARVWMEGRYVFDLDHGGWAELHPLYRWGDL